MDGQLRLRDFPIGKKKGRGVQAQAYEHALHPDRIFLRTRNAFKSEIFSNWVQGPHAPVIFDRQCLWDGSYLLEMEKLEAGNKSQGSAKQRFLALMQFSKQGLVLFADPRVQRMIERVVLPSEMACIWQIVDMAYNFAESERDVLLDVKAANIRVRGTDTLVFTDICHINKER